MSTGSSYANQSAASRPIITPEAQRNFNTWSSIDRELASHRVSPLAMGSSSSLRVALREKAHALFHLSSDALFVLGVVVAGLSCPVAIGWAGYICFFMKT